jgi:hypothetical protein
MALVATTLSSACSASDNFIVVASATSIAPGVIVKIDEEMMKVTNAYVLASTTVPVLRAQDGGVAVAHPVTAAVYHGLASDTEWGAQAPQTNVNYPIAGKAARYQSYSASGAIDLPEPGTDALRVLNAVSTTILAMTVALPTKAMDGTKLKIASRNGTGAHTITFAGRLNGAGSGNYTVFTFPANPVMIELTALDEFWYVTCGPAWTGTVTLLTGGIA